MKKEELIAKIKHIIYKITLPIYLWSIGFKTLDSYLEEIERQSRGYCYGLGIPDCDHQLIEINDGIYMCEKCGQRRIKKEFTS